VTRKSRAASNPKGRRLQSVTIKGGKPLPLMPRQTTRMFGFCGLTPQLFKQMAA
jgi:hypothetical protein